MPVKLKGATSGDITLDVPAVAGTNTLTLPAKTGNIITSADTGTVTQTMLAAGLAGKVYIKSVTASGATELDLTGWYSSAFDVYEIELVDMFGSVSGWSLLGRVSTDDGSTFDTGSNYNYSTLYSSGTAAGGSAASAAFMDFGGARGTNVSTDICGTTLKLFNPAGSRWKAVYNSSVYTGNTTNLVFTFFSAGIWRNTAAYNALRLYPSSGTITATARIYGLSKS